MCEFEELSLREKIGQTIIIKANPDEHKKRFGSLEAFLEKYPVGGIFVGSEVIKTAKESAKEVREIVDEYQKASKIPLLVAADVENGAGSITTDFTQLPSLMGLGATESEELAYEYGKASALEAVSAGINWTFSPVCDLNINPLNIIVNYRSVSDNGELAFKLLPEVIKGIQKHGLAATGKHFPGDGIDHRDQHITTSCNSLSTEEWYSSYGKVFKKVIDEGVCSIMAGHICLPAFQEHKLKDCYPPATLSHELIVDLLKNKMAFSGVVVSDALDMGGFVRWYDDQSTAEVECFKSGIDMLLWPFLSFFENLQLEIENGKVPIERLDDAVNRVLKIKKKIGLFADDLIREGISNANTEYTKSVAKAIAENSITLVANKLNLLPVKADKVKKVRIVGITPDDKLFGAAKTVVDEFEKRGAAVELKRNFITYGMEFKNADRNYDLLVYVLISRIQRPLGVINYFGDEAKSIITALSFDRNKSIILSLGSPYYYREYFESAETYINGYFYDEATIKAAVASIYGEIPFKGKSPVVL